MKKLFAYLKTFHQSYFSWWMYISFLLYVAILIIVNYHIDLEDTYIDHYAGRYIRILWFFLIHGLAYYGALGILWLYQKEKMRVSWRFWLKSALALLIISIDRSIYPMLFKWLLADLPYELIRFSGRILVNSYGLVTVVFSIFIVKLAFDRNDKEGLYGLRFSKVDFRFYGLLLLLMIPVLYGASFIPDIIDYYPTYKRAGGGLFAHYFDIKEWVSVLLYESVYLSDFLSTELVFRGLLVIGLSRGLGKNVVLPMVATYAVLHFGKPMSEAISSVLGGYVLGIIALYSRNIWGGVFIHGGVAFFMESFAFLRM